MARWTPLVVVAASLVWFAGCSSPEPAPSTPGPAKTTPTATTGDTSTNSTTGAEATSGGATTTPVNFEQDVVPMLTQHCAGCHGGAKPKGGLDLSAIKTKADAEAMKDELAKAAKYVESRRMPPPKAPQLTADDRTKLVNGLRSL